MKLVNRHFAELVNVYFSANCSSRLWCGLHPNSSFLTGFCPPPHLQTPWLLPTSDGTLLLRRAVFASCRSLRGALFIQDSSLLYTLSLKLLPLACLHKVLQRFLSFRKQNASGLNIRISTSSHSQKSLDARLRWFVSYVNLSHCAKCLMETDSSNRLKWLIRFFCCLRKHVSLTCKNNYNLPYWN